MTTNPTDHLDAAEARHGQILARLEAAQIARDELRATITKAKESYLSAAAGAELEGGSPPSRAELTALEAQLPDAEDRIAVLARAADEAARQVRLARADVLAEQAEAVRAETARRQARIHDLEPQLAAMQREISEHSNWIRNAGPLKATQLDAEAVRLRSRP